MLRKSIVIFIMFFVILSISGCDHTQLTGEIIINSPIKLGDTIPLKLEVPDELSGIYDTMWNVEPGETGELIWGEDLMEELTDEELKKLFGKKKEKLNPDRIALFTANKKAKCEIFVAGFYKQTNPQGITSIEIEIE